MDEEIKTETTELSTGDSGEGNQPEESKEIAKLRKENERMEKQIEKKKKLIAERKAMENTETLSGRAEAGMIPPKPEKESDEAYADKVARGEANPLKDDGFIS